MKEKIYIVDFQVIFAKTQINQFKIFTFFQTMIRFLPLANPNNVPLVQESQLKHCTAFIIFNSYIIFTKT